MTPQQTTLMNSRRRPGLHPAAICLVAIMSSLTAIKPGHSATLNPKSTPEKPQLWLYYSTNLLVNANVQRIRRIWSRARAEGYSHILLSDSKLAHLNNLGSIAQQYQRNVVRVRKLAARLGLVLVPSLFPIGYSNDILYDNPSLAEGLPVRDAPFVVENQIATPQPDPKISLGRRPTWKDSDIQLRNGTATLHNPPGNARLVFERTLHPFREYHIRVFIRTTQFTGRPRIAVLAEHSGRGTIVMNWNGGHKRKSLQFFARLGNRQIIAAYYDAPLSQTASWIAAAKPVRGVIGYMYTTWDGDYRQMGAFAALVKRAYQPGGK